MTDYLPRKNIETMPNNNNYYSTERNLESILKENINFLEVLEDYQNWTKYSEKYHFRIILYGSLSIWILNLFSILHYSRDYGFKNIYKASYLIGIFIPAIILLYSLQTIYLKYAIEKLRNDNIIIKQFLDRAKRDKYFDQKELDKLLARIGKNHKKLEKTYSNLLENLPKNLMVKPTTTRKILDLNRSLKELITKAISTVLGRRKIDNESNQTIKGLTSKNKRGKTNKISKTSKLGKLGSLRRSLGISRERNTRLKEKTKDSRMLERKMKDTEIFKNNPDKLKNIINIIDNESEKKRSNMENRMLESKNKEQRISNIQEYTQIVKNVNEKFDKLLSFDKIDMSYLNPNKNKEITQEQQAKAFNSTINKLSVDSNGLNIISDMFEVVKDVAETVVGIDIDGDGRTGYRPIDKKPEVKQKIEDDPLVETNTIEEQQIVSELFDEIDDLMGDSLQNTSQELQVNKPSKNKEINRTLLSLDTTNDTTNNSHVAEYKKMTKPKSKGRGIGL